MPFAREGWSESGKGHCCVTLTSRYEFRPHQRVLWCTFYLAAIFLRCPEGVISNIKNNRCNEYKTSPPLTKKYKPITLSSACGQRSWKPHLAQWQLSFQSRYFCIRTLNIIFRTRQLSLTKLHKKKRKKNKLIVTVIWLWCMAPEIIFPILVLKHEPTVSL